MRHPVRKVEIGVGFGEFNHKGLRSVTRKQKGRALRIDQVSSIGALLERIGRRRLDGIAQDVQALNQQQKAKEKPRCITDADTDFHKDLFRLSVFGQWTPVENNVKTNESSLGTFSAD